MQGDAFFPYGMQIMSIHLIFVTLANFCYHITEEKSTHSEILFILLTVSVRTYILEILLCLKLSFKLICSVIVFDKYFWKGF